MILTTLPEWREHAVVQRRSKTGCIPTGFEILLRLDGKCPEENFQEKFDLGDDANDFNTVAAKVLEEHPLWEFKFQGFPSGEDKLRFIKRRIEDSKPTLVSVVMDPLLKMNNAWFHLDTEGRARPASPASPNDRVRCHIMLVVGGDSDSLTLLYGRFPDGSDSLIKLGHVDLVQIHDQWHPHGTSVAWLID